MSKHIQYAIRMLRHRLEHLDEKIVEEEIERDSTVALIKVYAGHGKEHPSTFGCADSPEYIQGLIYEMTCERNQCSDALEELTVMCGNPDVPVPQGALFIGKWTPSVTPEAWVTPQAWGAPHEEPRKPAVNGEDRMATARKLWPDTTFSPMQEAMIRNSAGEVVAQPPTLPGVTFSLEELPLPIVPGDFTFTARRLINVKPFASSATLEVRKEVEAANAEVIMMNEDDAPPSSPGLRCQEVVEKMFIGAETNTTYTYGSPSSPGRQGERR